MKNWQKNRNFRKYENADESFIYVVTVDGERVEVSEEIYTAYANGGYKMENMEFGIKCGRVLQDSEGKAVRDENGNPIMLPEREVSLDKLIAEDWEYPSSEPSPEDVFIARFENEALHKCLDLLDADERELIDALFYDGFTERKYAKKLGISKTALQARKVRTLAKIKNLMEQ